MPFLTQGKTNWKYIIIVLIFAVIIGAGILGWIKKQEVPSGELPKIEKPEKVDETTDWKTYRNEEYGFEIKYPEDWGLREGPFEPPYPVVPGLVAISSPKKGLGGLNIIITEIPKEKSLEEYIEDLDLKGRKEFNVRDQEEVRLLGLSGIQRKEFWFSARFMELVTYFKKDNLIFRFSIVSMSSHETITDEDQRRNNQILSTFRFLE